MHPKAIELTKKYEELGERLGMGDPSSQEYIDLAKERAELEPFIVKYREMKQLEECVEGNKEILNSNEDEELKTMAKEELEILQARLEALDQEVLLMLLPQDELKDKNIIIEIRSGAGGDEAALFAGDLFRMYTRYAEEMHWKVKILNMHEIGIGGYKEISFEVKGKDVYGHFKYESGVHRVQRIPLTESGGRVHTSTASVAVLTEVEDVDIQIDPKDLRIDVFRASGAGGQHVNKTESAVRITHIPTNIVAACQDERSQLQNRQSAMKVLKARLFDMEQQKKIAEQVEKRRSMVGSGDRAEKIRTYNYSQNRVSDHRINLTLYKLDRIMEGDLEELINALIMSEQEVLLQSLNE